MSEQNSSLAYSGGPPGQYPQGLNIFDYVFGNPFEHESEVVPASQVLPHIDDRQPIYIDNKTGRFAFTPSRRPPSIRLGAKPRGSY